MKIRRIAAVALALCFMLGSVSCRRGSDEDKGLEYLEDKYPDYTFTYDNYADGRAYYNVEGFDARVVVGIAQQDPLEFYDNFQFIKYRDDIVDALCELTGEICSQVGVSDFNLSFYGGHGWMRDGELTCEYNVTEQTARDYTDEDLSFEDFMASPDTFNRLIAVICVEDAESYDLDELAQMIIDEVDDSGYVFDMVRIDFTDNADEFASSTDRRVAVYDYQYGFWAEPDEDGHITDYSWSQD